MGLSLKNLGSRLWDQINPLDNNRTFKNPQGSAKGKGPGYKAPSAFDQLTGQARKVGTGLGLSAVRSGTGVAQGLTGAYDLLTPGRGTNRASKFLDTFAKQTDATAKAEHINPFAYRAGQTLVDAGSMLTGLGELKAATTALKGATELPRAANAVRTVAQIAPRVEMKIASATRPLTESTNVASRLVGRGIQNAANPANVAINTAFTGKMVGENASKGRDTSPGSVAANIAMGVGADFGLPILAAGVKGGAQVARQGAKRLADEHLQPVYAAGKDTPKPKVAAKEAPAPVNEPVVNINGKDVTLSELKTQRAKLAGTKQKAALAQLDGHIKDLEELQALTGGQAKPVAGPKQVKAPQKAKIKNGPVTTETTPVPVASKPKVTMKQPKAPTTKQTISKSKAQLKTPTIGTEATNQTYKRIIKDKNIPTGSRKAIQNLTHEVHNQKKMQTAATSMVKTDLTTAQKLFDNESLVGSNPDAHIHLGNALNEHYNATGKLKQAGKVYDDMIATATRLGQGFNSLKAISKISVQGIVRHAEKIADAQGHKLAPELRKQLTKMAKDIAKMPDGAKKAQAIKNMLELAKQPTKAEKLWNAIKQVSSVPRTLMTSGDLSYALRQGAVLASTHPVIWAKSVAASAKMAISPKAFTREMNNVRNLRDINGDSMQAAYKKSRLYLPGIMGKNEEVFADSRIFETKAARKAGVGHVVMASERSFTGAATMQRALTLKKIVDDLGGIKKMDNWTRKDWEDLGRVLETATGRGRGSKGNPLGKWFEDAAPTFSQTIFSARLWKSRLDLLNPTYYARLSPVARKEAIKSSVAFAGIVGTVLAAADMAGADVEMDPRSTDFAKIKIGNTRYDIMGGLQQNIVVAARELTNSQKNKDGNIVKLNEGGPYDPSRLGVLTNLVTNKLAPVPSAGLHLLRGKDANFNPVNPWKEAAKLLIPLGIQDTAQVAANSKGKDGYTVAGVAKAVVQTSPSFGGVGVQNYNSGPKMVPGKTDVNSLSPKDLTKYKTTITRQFKNGLSDSDKQLFELSTNKEAAQLALKNGKVTQSKLDAIEAKFNRAKYKAGLPLTYVNGVSEGEFKQLDKSTQDLVVQASLKGRDAFVSSKQVDPTAAKAINDLMQNNPWPNVGEIKPTNKLALDLVYAEKDLLAVPDDQPAQYELVKKFWKRAVKEQYNDSVNQLYDGNASTSYSYSIADIKRLSQGLTVNGHTYTLNKDVLDKMVDLDNRLLTAGLIENPKFSNKTRAALGYGAAPTSKTDGLGYSGSKSSGGSGGRSGSKKASTAFANPYQYTVNFNASRGKARVSSLNVAKPQIKAAHKATVSKPKVSLKKAR
jgi:hypothetical protein